MTKHEEYKKIQEQEKEKKLKRLAWQEKIEKSLSGCRLCGEDAWLLESPPSPTEMQYHIECKDCQCSISSQIFDYNPDDETEEKDIVDWLAKQWNTRTTENEVKL